MKALLLLLAALAPIHVSRAEPSAPSESGAAQGTSREPIGPAPAQDSGRPWRAVDGIVMIVNQDIITESQLMKGLAQMQTKLGRKFQTDTERRQAQMQILGENVRKRLRIQAGAVLGVDEKLIDARVNESIEQMRKRQNGVVGLAKYLESVDVSGPDVRRLLREDIYDQIYRDGLTGEAPGPLGRVTADRYVRPGSLKLLFEQAIERPNEMEALGGSVGRVKFQQIVLDVSQNGGPDAARELAQTILARIAAGEDMGELSRQHGGGRDGDGVTEVEEARLRELFPEIAAFTSKAEPGQLSGPIETAPRGKPVVRIVRFLERTPAVVPDFSAAKVQETLRQRATERLEQYRLESGYAALLRASYVWPPELAGR